jgi:hypothetical protein
MALSGARDVGAETRPALPEILAQTLGRHDLQVIAPGETARLADQFESRWRTASRAGDAERIVETSTPDTLVVESLLGWLASRLPPRQPLVLLAARGREICGIRGLTPTALLRVHAIVRDSGESVRLMCPEGTFGLALEHNGRAAARDASSLFKLFVWGAPR